MRGTHRGGETTRDSCVIRGITVAGLTAKRTHKCKVQMELDRVKIHPAIHRHLLRRLLLLCRLRLPPMKEFLNSQKSMKSSKRQSMVQLRTIDVYQQSALTMWSRNILTLTYSSRRELFSIRRPLRLLRLIFDDWLVKKRNAYGINGSRKLALNPRRNMHNGL